MFCFHFKKVSLLFYNLFYTRIDQFSGSRLPNRREIKSCDVISHFCRKIPRNLFARLGVYLPFGRLSPFWEGFDEVALFFVEMLR